MDDGKGLDLTAEELAELEKAAFAGHIKAMLCLGDYYSYTENFQDGPRDGYKAAKYYHNAEIAGSGEDAEYAHLRNRQLRYEEETRSIAVTLPPKDPKEKLSELCAEILRKMEEKKMSWQTERLNTMKAILEKLNEDNGAAPAGCAWLCRPATDADIEECSKNLVELALPEIPKCGDSSGGSGGLCGNAYGLCYADFLRLHNGFAWNGVEFWGTHIVTEKGNERGYKLMDLVTMNNDYDNHYWEYHKMELLYIGRADDDIYVYNVDEKVYEIRSMEEACGTVYESFGTFPELFDFTVGGRLGWPGCGPFANGDDDDIDDAKYEHDEGRYDGEV